MIVAFVGYEEQHRLDDVQRFEDEVLRLLPDHGAAVLFRGRRVDGEDTALPAEVHILSFPSPSAFDAFLSDPRRREIQERFGEVFVDRVVVEVEQVAGLPHE